MRVRAVVMTLGGVLFLFAVAFSLALTQISSRMKATAAGLHEALVRAQRIDELHDAIEGEIRRAAFAAASSTDPADAEPAASEDIEMAFAALLRHATSPQDRELASKLRRISDAFFARHRSMVESRAPVDDMLLDAERTIEEVWARSAALQRSLMREGRALDESAARFDEAAAVVGSVLMLLQALTVLAFALLFLPPLVSGLQRIRERVEGLHAGAAGQAGDGAHGGAKPPGLLEVRELDESLDSVARDLERQRRERATAFGAIAHDLRNPITALTLSLERLERARSPEAQSALVAVLREQALRVDRMIDDLLDENAVEAGQFSLAIERFELSALLAAIVKRRSQAAPRHRYVLEAGAPCLLDADPRRLQQVFENLLDNAEKYSPHGGAITVQLEIGAASATIVVMDEGVGIDPAERELIFEPFRRGRGAAGGAQGLGLGLATVKRLVEAHGGTVSAGEGVRRGSAFTVRLPLPNAAVWDALPEAAQPPLEESQPTLSSPA